jgi:hypothetical protein
MRSLEEKSTSALHFAVAMMGAVKRGFRVLVPYDHVP